MEYYGTSFWAPTDTLAHHGVKGQKWGVRHWQNEDGTFNEAGKKRYFGNGGGENYKKLRIGGSSQLAGGRGAGARVQKSVRKSLSSGRKRFGSLDTDNSAEKIRSTGGNARRALAKVYDVNEKYYSKHGNKAMADANKQAKERMLKKADEADKEKNNRRLANKERKDTKKIDRINKRLDSYQRDIDSYNSQIMKSREKNRSKLEKKSKKASEKVSDFDRGTKYVKAGQDRVNKVVSDYREAKITAVKDKAFKQTDDYKRAIKSFNQLTRSGVPVSTLSYAFEAAADDVAKNK